jgi:hypothetical protein
MNCPNISFEVAFALSLSQQLTSPLILFLPGASFRQPETTHTLSFAVFVPYRSIIHASQKEDSSQSSRKAKQNMGSHSPKATTVKIDTYWVVFVGGFFSVFFYPIFSSFDFFFPLQSSGSITKVWIRMGAHCLQSEIGGRALCKRYGKAFSL